MLFNLNSLCISLSIYIHLIFWFSFITLEYKNFVSLNVITKPHSMIQIIR